MRASTALFAAAAALPALVSAQNISFIEELEAGLTALGLTSLAAAITSVNSTSAAQTLFAELSVGQWTVFAPSNQAFSGVPSNISSDPDLLAEVLTYHCVSGTFSQNSSFPNVTIGRTALSNSSGLVFLEGAQNQVLGWTNEGNTTVVLNQNTATHVLNSTVISNITVMEIDSVLDVPGSLSAALAANNLTEASTELKSSGLLDTLETTHGFTFFAPTDSAFSNVTSLLGSNSTELKIVLQNHVLNGTTQYTSEFLGLSSSGSLTSASGESLSFKTNSTGTFVTSAGVTAQITVPDIILENGVLHIVNQVLFNNQTDATAASSAFQSASSLASSIAASPTTETGPVGFTPSPTSSGSGSSQSSSSAMLNTKLNAGIAGFFGFLGAAIFAL